MEKDIYIISKPLQYFNVRNTDYRKRESRKVLVIYGKFIDSGIFYERIKANDKSWDQVVLVTSKLQKYLYVFFHKCDRLIVELDASFVMGILHKLRRFRKMYIFEEGFGSYRRDRFNNASGLKRLINQWTGVSNQFGYSRFLCGQYLYLPGLYKKLFPGYPKEILLFEKTFPERIHEELPFFLNLSGGCDEFLEIENKEVVIYLTTHKVDVTLLERIIKEQPSLEYFYVKPHPHLCNIDVFKQYNLSIIRSNIMLEFILQKLIENGNRVTVYHENSTAVIWFQDKINNRNIGKHFADYEEVASYIREYALKN